MATLATLCGIAVIACGLVAGVFLTFSEFVMQSLSAAQPAGGIESMQIINRKVYRTTFMFMLVGMTLISPVLMFYAYGLEMGVAAAFIGGGSLVYLVGVTVVSLACNVPMNQRLDAMDCHSAAAIAYWRVYVPRWTLWNHVRSFAATAAAICYFVGYVALI